MLVEYERRGNSIGYVRTDDDGNNPFWVLLTNFYAEIRSRTHHILDDATVETRFVIQMYMDGKDPVMLTLTEAEFDRMSWPSARGIVGAVIAAGPQRPRDDVRNAILTLSENVQTYVVIQRLGWYRIGDRPIYVAGDGPVLLDDAGTAEQTRVGQKHQLPDPNRFPELPTAKPTEVIVTLPSDFQSYGFSKGRQDAIQYVFTVIELLFNLGPGSGLLMIGAALTAVLGHGRFTVLLLGQPGSFKSTISSYALSFFAIGVSERNLTSSFSSTGNSLTFILGLMRDTSSVYDDLNHDHNSQSAKNAAESIARHIGNETNRQRLSGSQTLRESPRLRGVPIVTGEFFAAETSINTRTIRLENNDPTLIDVNTLTALNRFRDNGTLCGIMHGFVRWLTIHMPKIERRFPRLVRVLAKVFERSVNTPETQVGLNPRLTENYASMAASFEVFWWYIEDIGAEKLEWLIDDECSPKPYPERAKKAWYREMKKIVTAKLSPLHADQQQQVRGQLLPNMVWEVVRDLLRSATVHVISRSGPDPNNTYCDSLGWRRQFNDEYAPGGLRVGWFDEDPKKGNEILFLPGALATAVNEFCRKTGRRPVYNAATLAAALEPHLARRDTTRKTLTVRISINGRQHHVLAVAYDTLFPANTDDDDDEDDVPVMVDDPAEVEIRKYHKLLYGIGPEERRDARNNGLVFWPPDQTSDVNGLEVLRLFASNGQLLPTHYPMIQEMTEALQVNPIQPGHAVDYLSDDVTATPETDNPSFRHPEKRGDTYILLDQIVTYDEEARLSPAPWGRSRTAVESTVTIRLLIYLGNEQPNHMRELCVEMFYIKDGQDHLCLPLLDEGSLLPIVQGKVERSDVYRRACIQGAIYLNQLLKVRDRTTGLRTPLYTSNLNAGEQFNEPAVRLDLISYSFGPSVKDRTFTTPDIGVFEVMILHSNFLPANGALGTRVYRFAESTSLRLFSEFEKKG